MLLSEAKVARRWASCGDAARRRSGGAGLEAEADVLVGDEEFVGEEAGQMLVLTNVSAEDCGNSHLSFFSAGS